MDPLTQQLMQRAMAGQDQAQPDPAAPPLPDQTTSASMPTVLPTQPTKVPQRTKRFQNAQAIQDAYRNGWSPNPILLRAQLGHK